MSCRHFPLPAHLCYQRCVSLLCSSSVHPPPHLSHISLINTALLPVSLNLHLSLYLTLCYSLIGCWFVCFCPRISPVCFSGLSSVVVLLLYFPLPSFCCQFLLSNISSCIHLDFCLSVSCLLVTFVLTVTVKRRGGV